MLLLPFFSSPLKHQRGFSEALAMTVTPSVTIVSALNAPTNLTANGSNPSPWTNNPDFELNWELDFFGFLLQSKSLREVQYGEADDFSAFWVHPNCDVVLQFFSNCFPWWSKADV